MLPALSPARRRLRAVRHQLRRRRRLLAAALAAAAVLAGLRVVTPPAPDTVRVLVAARDLPSGTQLDERDVEARDFPADLAPGGRSADPVGRVLAGPVTRGSVLTDSSVVGPGLASADPGETVLPVRLPDAGMAGLLRPGDEVDLVATDPADGVSSVVATGVRVLATPSTSAPDAGAAQGTAGALVVVGVSSYEAPRIASAALTQFLTVSWKD